jgi:hypothetical protein
MPCALDGRKYSSSCTRSGKDGATADSRLEVAARGQFVRSGLQLFVRHFHAGSCHDHSVADQLPVRPLCAGPRKALCRHLQAATGNDQARRGPLGSRDAPDRHDAKRGNKRRSVFMSVSRKPGQLAAGDAGCVLTIQNVFCDGKKLCQFQRVTHVNTARIRCAMLMEGNDICARVENCKDATTLGGQPRSVVQTLGI